MSTTCIVYRTIDLIVKRWSLLILLVINRYVRSKKGNDLRYVRYSEIKKSLPGITAKVLSTRLKELELEGIIVRRVDTTTKPAKTYYALTPAGKDLLGIISSMKKWGMKWKFKSQACHDLACERCEKDL